jgi:hypothetical protein
MPLSHNSHVSECELTHTAIVRDGACLLQGLGLTVPDKPLVAADEVSPCHPSVANGTTMSIGRETLPQKFPDFRQKLTRAIRLGHKVVAACELFASSGWP